MKSKQRREQPEVRELTNIFYKRVEIREFALDTTLSTCVPKAIVSAEKMA
jgi:hypothetical protein